MECNPLDILWCVALSWHCTRASVRARASLLLLLWRPRRLALLATAQLALARRLVLGAARLVLVGDGLLASLWKARRVSTCVHTQA